MNEQTIRQAVLNAMSKEYFYRNEKEFANAVVWHVRAIEQKQIEARIWAAMIPVDLDKVEESYADGLETGKGWVRDYVPGGPWKYRAGEHDSDRTKAIAEQTLAEYDAWHQGFVDSGAVVRANLRRMR
jgi:hypothetical protein